MYNFSFIADTVVSYIKLAGPAIQTLGIVILTSFFTYWFSIRAYLQQKKGERVRETYIEEGLNTVLTVSDQLSTICYLNYAKVLLVFDTLENTTHEPTKSKEVIESIFSEMSSAKSAPDNGILKLSVFNNVSIMLLVTKMWTEYQQLSGNLKHGVKLLVNDYVENNSKYTLSGKIKFIHEHRNAIRKEWRRVMDEYEPLKGYLLQLQIEVDKMDLLKVEDLDKIADNKEIKRIVGDIITRYKSSISKLSGES